MTLLLFYDICACKHTNKQTNKQTKNTQTNKQTNKHLSFIQHNNEKKSSSFEDLTSYTFCSLLTLSYPQARSVIARKISRDFRKRSARAFPFSVSRGPRALVYYFLSYNVTFLLPFSEDAGNVLARY
jgi:hypothetical protein